MHHVSYPFPSSCIMCRRSQQAIHTELQAFDGFYDRWDALLDGEMKGWRDDGETEPFFLGA